EDHAVLAHEDDLQEVPDHEGRDQDLGVLQVGFQGVDPIGHMGVFAHRGGYGGILAIAQELDVLRVSAGVGHPDLAGLDPILPRLRFSGGYAHVIEDVLAHHPILTTSPVRADSSAARVASRAAVASSGVPMVTGSPFN